MKLVFFQKALGVGADLLFRTFGFNRVALEEYETLPPEFKQDLINYTNGINAYIESKPQRSLSLEHFLLQFINPDYEVDKYEPHYPLAWAKMMAYDLNGNFQQEIRNSKTFNSLTPEISSLLTPPYPDEHPLERSSSKNFDDEPKYFSAINPFFVFNGIKSLFYSIFIK